MPGMNEGVTNEEDKGAIALDAGDIALLKTWVPQAALRASLLLAPLRRRRQPV